MGIFTGFKAWRAAALTAGIIFSGAATDLKAASLITPGASELLRRSAEPFGQSTAPLTEGRLPEKWAGVEHRLDDERVQIALCEGDPANCASAAARQFLAIVDQAKDREGRARLGEVNRAFNLAIRPMSDLAQYGEMDVWSSPLATLFRGAGDCEDYAIAKFAALRWTGVPAGDLRIVILRDIFHGGDHAVVAARLDGHWLTLDNNRMTMIEDVQVRNVRPVFVIDEDGVRRYQESPSDEQAGRNLVSATAGLPGDEASPL